jgi:GMP reductase
MMGKKFDFEDITLLPNFSYVNSRSDCNTSVKFGGYRFKLPVVPANMESIVDEELARNLAKNGYFYILHRFDVNIPEFISNMKSENLVTSISVGVNEDSYDLIHKLVGKNLIPEFVTIDIAHGHSIKMKNMVKFLRNKLPNTFIIGGNVCTAAGVIDLEEWGCDAVKVGIAGGSACTTYHSTGFGNRGWQANMIKDCCKVAKKPIIADGSIKENSDIVKSLVLGASMVMVGGMLSGYKESPGKLIQENDIWYKTFWGSASSSQSGKTNRIEGIKKLIPFKNESIFVKLTDIEESLQSAISYAGGNPATLDSFLFVDYVVVK